MKCKQVFQLFNLMFLCRVFVCKCTNFQEKDYSLYQIEVRDVLANIPTLAHLFHIDKWFPTFFVHARTNYL